MLNENISQNDIAFMKKVLALAKKAVGLVSPNPMVGAIVVKDNKIIASDYHKKYGEKHAERLVLEKAGSLTKGATLYVNLEPCCHTGKTPPCTDIIIESGIKKVVVAMKDPNPLVKDSEIILKEAGIETVYGVLEQKARQMNQCFIKNMKYSLPYITLKLATTLDGKIADSFYNSKWITNDKSREYVQQLRFENDAILVGAGTICADNPLLNVRAKKRKEKWTKIIIDPFLQTPLNAKIFDSKDSIVIVTQDPTKINSEVKEKFKKSLKDFSDKECDFIFLELTETGFDIKKLLKEIYNLGIYSVFVEGGHKVASSFLETNSVDRFIRFISPRLMNDAKAISMFSIDKTKLVSPLELKLQNNLVFDNDIMLDYLLLNY
jgi:diaminohydroxyphosphoribosylaminopyrimidine deaminase / 5-amino-6-(5-phosphoribosylamino)uracil reductase